MTSIPYETILRKAYRLTVDHAWLWVFGLFLGGGSIADFLEPRFDITDYQSREEMLGYFRDDPEKALAVAGLAFLVVLAVLALQVFAKAAILWAGKRLVVFRESEEKRKKLTLVKVVSNAAQYFFPLFGVEFVLALAMVILLALFIVPIAYLFSAGAVLRAGILIALGVIIFIPVLLVFIFTYLLAPIFVVVFESRVKKSIKLAVDLFRQKFKECIVFGLLISFINAGLILSVIFITILASLLTSGAAGDAVVFILGLVIVVLNSALAVFYNLAWVLAVKEMVNLNQSEEEAYAAEPIG